MIAFGVLLVGYWITWYGWATLRQPTGENTNGVGIMDLIRPSQITHVDQVIANDWNVNGDLTSGNLNGQPNGNISPDYQPSSSTTSTTAAGTGSYQAGTANTNLV